MTSFERLQRSKHIDSYSSLQPSRNLVPASSHPTSKYPYDLNMRLKHAYRFGNHFDRISISDPATPVTNASIDTNMKARAVVTRSIETDSASIFEAATRKGSTEVPFRKEMETAFQQDFGHIKAYPGRNEAGEVLGVFAATQEEKIMFAPTRPSKELVAHELTHVMQNRLHGSSSAVQAAGVLESRHPAEQEAETVAQKVAVGRLVQVTSVPSIGIAFARARMLSNKFNGIPEGAEVSYDDSVDLTKARIVKVTYTLPDSMESISVEVHPLLLKPLPRKFLQGPSSEAMEPDTTIPVNAANMGLSTATQMQAVREEDKRENSGVWYASDYNEVYTATHEKPMPENYWLGFANLDYFAPLKVKNKLTLLPGKSAAEALDAFFRGLTICECYSVIVAAHYRTILRAIGREKFDKLFGSATDNTPNDSLLLIEGGATFSDKNPLSKYLIGLSVRKDAPNVLGKRSVSMGDWAYFGNHTDYLLRHPRGSAAGWNVVCTGKNAQDEDLWRGFGFKKDLTEFELLDMMVDEYNKPQTKEDREEIDAKKSKMEFKSKDDIKEEVNKYSEKEKKKIDWQLNRREMSDTGYEEQNRTVKSITRDGLLNSKRRTIGLVEITPGYNTKRTHHLNVSKVSSLLLEN